MSNVETFEQWEEIGDSLRALRDGHQWWIGDWWDMGETRWEVKAFASVGPDDLADQTFLNYSWIARSFKPEERRPSLSFSHHAVLAKQDMDRALRTKLMDQAEEYSWSVRTLKEQLRLALLGDSIDKTPDPEDLDDPESGGLPDVLKEAEGDAKTMLAERGLGTPANAIGFMLDQTLPDLFGDDPAEVAASCETEEDLNELRKEAYRLHEYSKVLLRECASRIN